MIERGCGKRKKGGVYAELPCIEGGLPIEAFILCPTIQIDGAALGLTGVNQVLTDSPNGDCKHILDWIGERYYPHPVSWIEEVRRFGMSQRCELRDYSGITDKSRWFPVHAKASCNGVQIKDLAAVRRDLQNIGYRWSNCPHEIVQGKEQHDPFDPERFCAGYLWQTTNSGKIVNFHQDTFEVNSQMPSFLFWSYHACFRIEWRPAIFGSFPIARWVVINDPDDGKHEAKLKILNKTAQLSVELVEE